MIYLDNAATSWPKPPEVTAAMVQFIEQVGGNPGRAGHRLAVESARIVYAARQAIADLFGVRDPMRVIWGANVTEALNLALHGLLRPGDHVITSSMEHNSVMRPLRTLEAQGVAVTVVACWPDGALDPCQIEAAIRDNTTMIVLTHASNVVGTLLPVAEVGRIARRHGLLFLVDAAQTAGAYPLDMEDAAIDLLAFTGHKSLYGPMGTGGLVIGPRIDTGRLRPLKQGGTGSRSEREEQPAFLPDRYESGTPNVVGLAGLAAGVAWVQRQGIAAIRAHEVALSQRLIDGLAAIPGVHVYGSLRAERQMATVSFRIAAMDPADVGLRLDEEYAIMCRVGLHCSPAAHRTIGTFPAGTVRFGLAALNHEAEVDAALVAVERLAKGVS